MYPSPTVLDMHKDVLATIILYGVQQPSRARVLQGMRWSATLARAACRFLVSPLPTATSVIVLKGLASRTTSAHCAPPKPVRARQRPTESVRVPLRDRCGMCCLVLAFAIGVRPMLLTLALQAQATHAKNARINGQVARAHAASAFFSWIQPTMFAPTASKIPMPLSIPTEIVFAKVAICGQRLHIPLGVCLVQQLALTFQMELLLPTPFVPVWALRAFRPPAQYVTLLAALSWLLVAMFASTASLSMEPRGSLSSMAVSAILVIDGIL